MRRNDATPFLYPEMAPEHTAGHVRCPACELARTQMIQPAEFGALRFSMAASLWLSEHKLYIAERTVADYAFYFRSLNRFFGELPLREIHIGHIQEYQKQRSEKVYIQTLDGKRKKVAGAGPSVVNHEVNALSQVLARAGLWVEIERFYKPLPLPKPSVGRALTTEEEERLWMVASTNKRWKVAYWCSLLTANTTAGPSEIVNLRIADVDLEEGVMYVREGTKNDYRVRPIPLNETALWAMKNLVKRARELGSTDPEHCLLPHRAHTKGAMHDPLRPMGSWRRAWESLREKAGLPKLRRYDLRHHSLTRLLENPEISEQTIIDIAGHVSRQMLKRYSHIRMKPKRDALASLERKPAQPANDVSNVIPIPKPLKSS